MKERKKKLETKCIKKKEINSIHSKKKLLFFKKKLLWFSRCGGLIHIFVVFPAIYSFHRSR